MDGWMIPLNFSGMGFDTDTGDVVENQQV